FDLKTFDPTWLLGDPARIPDKLRAQMLVKADPKLHTVSQAYLDFLGLGGVLRFEDLTRALIRRILNRRTPILVGLSSTYLYREAREVPATNEDNDIAGLPAGHFVVLHGYDQTSREVSVADPYADNPLAEGHGYTVPIDRVICSILLGIVTYDANLLVIEPRTDAKSSHKGTL
ncbi:MAG: peptidase-C39 like family protein, partial [Bilophila sp.]